MSGKIFYVCSYGGCGSTMLFKYLNNFGKVYHVHDRYPPNNLTHIGGNVYSEWFNNIPVDENTLQNTYVIFIYRNPIDCIYSRCVTGIDLRPNIPHLQHIKCINNGNISLQNIISTNVDLYGLEKFFDSYLTAKNNYDIICVKYESIWSNLSYLNTLLGIPNIPSLYPVKNERYKKYKPYYQQLVSIYTPLLQKMASMQPIFVVKKHTTT